MAGQQQSVSQDVPPALGWDVLADPALEDHRVEHHQGQVEDEGEEQQGGKALDEENEQPSDGFQQPSLRPRLTQLSRTSAGV